MEAFLSFSTQTVVLFFPFLGFGNFIWKRDFIGKFDESKKWKKNKYASTAEQWKATFMSVIATCEPIFDYETEVYYKKISALLSSKLGMPYS